MDGTLTLGGGLQPPCLYAYATLCGHFSSVSKCTLFLISAFIAVFLQARFITWKLTKIKNNIDENTQYIKKSACNDNTKFRLLLALVIHEDLKDYHYLMKIGSEYTIYGYFSFLKTARIKFLLNFFLNFFLNWVPMVTAKHTCWRVVLEYLKMADVSSG